MSLLLLVFSCAFLWESIIKYNIVIVIIIGFILIVILVNFTSLLHSEIYKDITTKVEIGNLKYTQEVLK